MIKLNVSEKFSTNTGGRNIKDGPNSGEDFRKKFLINYAKKAYDEGDILLVDLDGGYGHSYSFLEEAFGGLIRYLEKEKAEYILKNIIIKYDDDINKIDEIKSYMKDAFLNKK